MARRIVALWFRYLLCDWQVIRRPELTGLSFVFTRTDRGRTMITEPSIDAQNSGAHAGMRVADAKVFVPGLVVIEDKPGRADKLLKGLAEWACPLFTHRSGVPSRRPGAGRERVHAPVGRRKSLLAGDWSKVSCSARAALPTWSSPAALTWPNSLKGSNYRR